MNVHFLLFPLIFFNLIGNNLPGVLYLAGYTDKCTASERSSILFGFILSLSQLTYLIQIIKNCIKATSIDQSERYLIQTSPKLFLTFIYQLYFVAMSNVLNLTGQTPCSPMRIQQISFTISSGIYAFIWLRGILFGYEERMESKLLVAAMQVTVFLATSAFQYSITSSYGDHVLTNCVYVPPANLFIITTIFALISLSYAILGIGTVGFLLSLPVCQVLWQLEYMITVLGWIIKFNGGHFDTDEMLSSMCSYLQPNYVLWSLPFVVWFFISMSISLVRFSFLQQFGPPYTEANVELFKKGSPLRQKTFGKHKLPARITDETKCTICWEEFVLNEKVSYVEDCLHIYHSSCINRWNTEENQCPLCKRRIKMKLF